MKRSPAVVFAVVALFVLGACGGGDKKPTTSAATTASTAGDSLKVWQTAPPWPLTDRQADRIADAGLPLLTAEGTKVHYHAHLDVFRNGDPVTVPANIGIDYQRQVISPLHTHDDSGIVHVEGLKDEPITLGQFLTEWGVRVESDCTGDICPPDPIAVYVDGVKQTGPVTELVFKSRQEVALVLGTPPKTIPSTFANMPAQ